MTPPERSPERDAALDLLAATTPFPGWTVAALRQTAGADADLLFPAGPLDMVESWCDLTDRRMTAVEGEHVSDRLRAILAARLAGFAGQRDAVRRATALLAAHPAAGARTLARTVDALWFTAGDRGADISWYTKRAILAGIYTASLLFWLRDTSEGASETLAFLDRRLAEVGQLSRLRARYTG